MVKLFSMKICSLDHPLVLMNNATLCTTLMAVKALDGKHLLLSVDHSWSGQGFSFIFSAKYCIKAQEFVEYLPKYLQHEHGDAIFCWFTLEAITKAKEMGWDDKLQQPISQDGIDLKADLKLLDFEWCIPLEKPVKIDLTKDNPVDMDNISLPSFQTLGAQGMVNHPTSPPTQLSAAKPMSTSPPHASLATVHLDNLQPIPLLLPLSHNLRQTGNSSSSN